jgi:hypothetical protein
VERSESETHRSQTPVRHAGFEYHGRQTDAAPVQAGPNQVPILFPAPANVIRNPFGIRPGEFGNHYQRQLGKDSAETLDHQPDHGI